jgi:hypothetical protein
LIKHRDEWSDEKIDITQAAPWSVKTGGDFEEILAKEKPEIWESHRPAKGGDAGKMFEKIIRRAEELSKSRKGAKRAKARIAPSLSGRGLG